MKKLICADDITKLVKQGGKTLWVEPGTVFTPSAKDAVKAAGLTICEGKPEFDSLSGSDVKTSSESGQISSDAIYTALKLMQDKGILGESTDKAPELYSSETDASGIKLVRGKSVKMDVLDTGNPDAKARYQELISASDGTHIPSGFLEIDNSEFEWELEGYEEIDYVIEGTLSISINGRTLTAHAGDVFFIPAGAKVVWCSPDKARVFYSTYFVN